MAAAGAPTRRCARTARTKPSGGPEAHGSRGSASGNWGLTPARLGRAAGVPQPTPATGSHPGLHVRGPALLRRQLFHARPPGPRGRSTAQLEPGRFCGLASLDAGGSTRAPLMAGAGKGPAGTRRQGTWLVSRIQLTSIARLQVKLGATAGDASTSSAGFRTERRGRGSIDGHHPDRGRMHPLQTGPGTACSELLFRCGL